MAAPEKLKAPCNVPEAFWVIEECRERPSEPYALRITLVWSLIGPRTYERPDKQCENPSINFASVGEDRLDDQTERACGSWMRLLHNTRTAWNCQKTIAMR